MVYLPKTAFHQCFGPHPSVTLQLIIDNELQQPRLLGFLLLLGRIRSPNLNHCINLRKISRRQRFRLVGQNPAVLASRCDDQVKQLVVNPLKNASDLCDEFVEAPKVIIIHGLEDHNDNDNFQTYKPAAGVIFELSFSMERLSSDRFSFTIC